jgi:polysaccharide export outer membrane protein
MPGMYKLRSETSLLQIIPIAGGFTEWADQKRIMIIRKEKGVEKRITASYKKILDTSESSDVVLKSGDTVVVP